ncbi:uncharacterized protein TNCV_2844401 [Trichonephila clavipes]|nr:uncharacterized protein TNCV_2844401 [Trichonephila clavipes]
MQTLYEWGREPLEEFQQKAETRLRANEAVVHAKTATEALSNASKIWEPGYSYYKMVYNLQGLYVDYKGRLMDGETVIENDVLNVFHYTDVMSVEGFQHLLDTTLQ